MQEPDRRRVVALTADLLFASRIRAAAEAAGVDLALPRSADAAAAAVPDRSAVLVLVDLDLRWTDPAAFITRLRERDGSDARIVAFASHVRADAIRAARDAGADRVLARSAFVRELPSLLAELLSSG